MPSPRTKPSRTSLVAFGMIVTLVLYVLSIGPLSALADAGYISPAWAIVYWPLHLCYDRSESFASALDWYIDLWVRQPEIATPYRTHGNVI